MDLGQLRDAWASVLRLVGWHRRLLVAALTAIAVAAGLSAVAPKPPRSVDVWTAARDLSGGAPLRARDVVLRALPVADVPAGALHRGAAVVGRLLGAPMRRGEPLTDVRLLGTPLLEALGGDGLVAVPVRVTDGAATAALVHAGDVVDVLTATDSRDGPGPAPASVATAVRVLAVPARDEASGDPGGLVVVAATPEQASALARASSVTRFSLALRRP